MDSDIKNSDKMLESDDHTILEIDSDSGDQSVNDSVVGTQIEQSATNVTSSEKGRSTRGLAYAEGSGSDTDEHAGVFDYYPGPTKKINDSSFNNSDQNAAFDRSANAFKSETTRCNARYDTREASDWTRAREFCNASANNARNCEKEAADDGIELKTVRPIYRNDDQSYSEYLSGLSRNNIDYICARALDGNDNDEPSTTEEKNEETRVRSEYQARRVSYGTIGRPTTLDVVDDDQRQRYGGGASSDTVGGMSSFPYSALSRTGSGSREGLWSADTDDRYGYGRCSEVNSNAELLSCGGGGGGGGASEGRERGNDRSLYMDRSRGELITHNSLINSAADCDQEERSHFLAHSRLSSASNSERNLESSRPILYFPDYQMFNNGTFLDGPGGSSSSSLLAERAEVTRRMERKKMKKQIAEGKFKKSEDHPEYKGDMTVEEILEFINVGRIGRRGLTTEDSSSGINDVNNDKTDKAPVKKNKKKVYGVQTDANEPAEGEKVSRTNVKEHELGKAVAETMAASAFDIFHPTSDDFPTEETPKLSRADDFVEAKAVEIRPILLANDNNNVARESTTGQSLVSNGGWTVPETVDCDDEDASDDIVRKINVAGEKKINPNSVEFNDTNSETDSVVSSLQESSMSDAAVVPAFSERGEVEFTTVRKKKKVKYSSQQQDNVHDFLRRGSDLAHASVNSYNFKKPTKTRYVTNIASGSGGGGGVGNRPQFESVVRQNADTANFNVGGARTTQFSRAGAGLAARPTMIKMTKAQNVVEESSLSIPCHVAKTSPNSIELNDVSLNVVSFINLDTYKSSSLRTTTKTDESIVSKLNAGPSYAKMVGDSRDVAVSSFAPANFPNLPTTSSSISSSSARRNSTGNVEPEDPNETLGAASKTSVVVQPQPAAAAIKLMPCASSYASIAKGGGPKSGVTSSSAKIEKERRRSLESVEIDVTPMIANQLNFPPIAGSRVAEVERVINSAEKTETRRVNDVVMIAAVTGEKSFDYSGATSKCCSLSDEKCDCKRFVENSNNESTNAAKNFAKMKECNTIPNVIDNNSCDTVVVDCDELRTAEVDTPESMLSDDQLTYATSVTSASPLLVTSSNTSTTHLDTKPTNQNSTVTCSSSSTNKSKPSAITTGNKTTGSGTSSRMQAEPVVFLDVRNYSRHEQISSKEIGISFGFDASESVDSGLGDICNGGGDVIGGSNEPFLGSEEVCSDATRENNFNHDTCVAFDAGTTYCGDDSRDPDLPMIPNTAASCTVSASAAVTSTVAATSVASNETIFRTNNAVHGVTNPPEPHTVLSHLKCIKCQQSNNSITSCNNTDTATSPILASEYEAAINSSSTEGGIIIPHSVILEDFAIASASRSIGGASLPVVYTVSQASHSRPIALMSGTSSAQGPPRAPVGVVPPLHYDRSKPSAHEAAPSNLKDAAGYISVRSLQPIGSYDAGKSILCAREEEEELRNEPRRKVQLQNNSSSRKLTAGRCYAENKTTGGCFDLSSAQLFVFKGYEETIASKNKYPAETMSYSSDA